MPLGLLLLLPAPPRSPRWAESLQTFNLRSFIIRKDYFLFLL